jgi:hypothetical protein
MVSRPFTPAHASQCGRSALADLAHERRVAAGVAERDDLNEQRRRPQVRVIGEPGPDVDLEVDQRIIDDSDTNAGLAVAVQIGPHRLAVALEMAGDGRDRPAPFLQRVGFHVFSLCEHGERGSFELVGVRTASVDGAPPQLVDLAVAHPALQG